MNDSVIGFEGWNEGAQTAKLIDDELTRKKEQPFEIFKIFSLQFIAK